MRVLTKSILLFLGSSLSVYSGFSQAASYLMFQPVKQQAFSGENVVDDIAGRELVSLSSKLSEAVVGDALRVTLDKQEMVLQVTSRLQHSNGGYFDFGKSRE